MDQPLSGIHHVTAIAAALPSNLYFYQGVLALRLVKITVNFDDPGSFHLYYGDGIGNPGSLLTFFIWPESALGSTTTGRYGHGQISTISLSVPVGSLEYWQDRFQRFGVTFEPLRERSDELVLPFYDPDGLKLQLVAVKRADERKPWTGGDVSAEYAVRGIYSVTITEAVPNATAEFLSAIMNFRLAATEEGWRRYVTGAAEPGSFLDLEARPDLQRARIGVGTVHHVAWRVANDDSLLLWRQKLLKAGYPVSPVRDRLYFHSIYFKEPGGVLFEIATDGPGFAVDEKPEELGSRLCLPPWLEERRAELKAALPPIGLPIKDNQ